jgi:hypothetical protein
LRFLKNIKRTGEMAIKTPIKPHNPISISARACIGRISSAVASRALFEQRGIIIDHRDALDVIMHVADMPDFSEA